VLFAQAGKPVPLAAGGWEIIFIGFEKALDEGWLEKYIFRLLY
jgi:hypothetical protein